MDMNSSFNLYPLISNLPSNNLNIDINHSFNLQPLLNNQSSYNHIRLITVSLLAVILLTSRAVCVWLASPLSKFPGPALAALTRLYEAYHVIIKNDWLENLEALHKKHGPIVRIGPNELHFADHEFCLEHHKRLDLGKCTSYYGLLDKLLGGLANPHSHAQRKSAIKPLFSGKNLSQFSAGILNDHLDRLTNRLAETITAKDGTKANATYYLWAFTNDVMLSYLLGIDTGYLKEPDLVKVHDSLRSFGAIDLATVLRAIRPVKIAFDWFPFLRQASPLGWIDEIVGAHLKSALKDPKVNLQGEDNQPVLTRLWSELGDEQLVIQEAAQAVFIGNESLLSNLTFLLHYMLQNPECINKLRGELDTLNLGTCGSCVWRDPEILQLKYLDAVCRESTRLSHPGWHRQPRQIPEPTSYNGEIIPPMTSLSFTPRMLERDPVLFQHPETFNPERWLGDSIEAQKIRSNSVTFGTGSRTCLGQNIARVVLRKTVACIFYNFNISFWDEEQDKKEGYRYLDTYPKKRNVGYLRIRLEPRFRD